MNVPTAHTLGCSWRIWPDPNISKQEKEKVISYINSEAGIKGTQYIHVPELGLFLPHEGKNRVNFCRFHNIEHIPANTSTVHYPDTQRIKIYVRQDPKRRDVRDVLAILDNRYVQKVNHYAYALPLLRAYGVTVLDAWPKDLLKPSVLLGYEHQFCSNKGFKKETIDINDVRAELDRAEEKRKEDDQYISCTLIDLPIKKKFVHLALIPLFMLLSAIIWESFDEGIIATVAFAILAFTSGIFSLNVKM